MKDPNHVFLSPTLQTHCPLSITTLHTTAPTQMEMERLERVPAPRMERLGHLPPSAPASLPPFGQLMLILTRSQLLTAAALSPSSSSHLISRTCAAMPGAMTTARWRGGTSRSSLWKSRSQMTPSCSEDEVEWGRCCLFPNWAAAPTWIHTWQGVVLRTAQALLWRVLPLISQRGPSSPAPLWHRHPASGEQTAPTSLWWLQKLSRKFPDRLQMRRGVHSPWESPVKSSWGPRA